MWESCFNENPPTGTLPATEADVLMYIAWLLKRGLCGTSIDSYLAGIRTAHLTKGLTPPVLRSDIVKTVIAGQKHVDQRDKRTGTRRTRLPITPEMLKLLKAELVASTLHKYDKLMVWAVATIAFFGGFRIGELLCQKTRSFDPDYELLGSNIKEITIDVNSKKVRTLQITIKSQKTDKSGAATIVDVYESGTGLCPVAAFSKYRKKADYLDPSMPAFCSHSEKPLTKKQFNLYLKQFLGSHLDTPSSYVSGHSFRSGIASLIAELGYSDQQIKDLGRWSSQAYLTYLKLPRTRRLEMAKNLSGI